MGEVLIRMKDLKKSYGRSTILRGVDMEVEKGDIYGLIGRNGSGKTTIFKILLGLSAYDSGEMHIGYEKDTLSEGRRRIGFFIGQHFFSYMTAAENLDYYRRLKGIPDKGEIGRVLKLVGLENAANKKIFGFSMGMRQRLGIADAMLGSPEIMILDEPVNGLDPQGIADIRNLVKRINEEQGITVIISSHILSELQNTAGRFGILNDGVIIKELSSEDLKGSNDSIRLRVDDAERARRLLAENGIGILNETMDTMSLEDYYFHLIGGPEK